MGTCSQHGRTKIQIQISFNNFKKHFRNDSQFLKNWWKTGKNVRTLVTFTKIINMKTGLEMALFPKYFNLVAQKKKSCKSSNKHYFFCC